MKRFFVLLANIVLLMSVLISPAMAQDAQTARSTIVHFSVVDRTGQVVPNAGRLDIWIRATGGEFQSVPRTMYGVGFAIQQGVEYQAFLGLAPWPEAGVPVYRIVGIKYEGGIEATTDEVGPYASFVVPGVPHGFVTYIVAPVNEVFLPAIAVAEGE